MFTSHLGITSIKLEIGIILKYIDFSGNKGISNLEIQVHRLFSILLEREIHHNFTLFTAAKNSKTNHNKNFKMQDAYSCFKKCLL